MDGAIQTLGGNGYINEFPAGRAMQNFMKLVQELLKFAAWPRTF